MADAPPEIRQRPARAVAAALGPAVGEHHGVHGPGAGGGDAVDHDALVLRDAIEHAPEVKAPWAPPPWRARLMIFCPTDAAACADPFSAA